MRDEAQQFALAAMSPPCAVVTVLFLLLAPAIVFFLAFTSPPEVTGLPPSLAVFLSAVYLFVWGHYRPRRFEVSPQGLRIAWPFRCRFMSAGEIVSTRLIDRREVGFALRLWGAGGLFGLFGLCWSRRQGRFDAFLTRSDGLVLVEFIARRKLLITPDRPDEFVRALQAVLVVPPP